MIDRSEVKDIDDPILPAGSHTRVIVDTLQHGWIVWQEGKPPEAFSRWECVVMRLRAELTDDGLRRNPTIPPVESPR
jgi:hypothetical protein